MCKAHPCAENDLNVCLSGNWKEATKVIYAEEKQMKVEEMQRL